MGGCASVNKGSDSSKPTKLRLIFWSKTDQKVVLSSAVKDKPTVSGDRPIPQGGLRSQSPSATTVFDLDSKEDAFFDSQPWPESDCEDDFFSVKGDFTPSCGNTPVHHSFSIGSLRVNKSPFNESTPVSSPGKKKRLLELFQESLREDEDVGNHTIFSDNQDKTNEKVGNKTGIPGLPLKPASGTLLSSEGTRKDGDNRAQKEKTMKAAHCCIPRVLSSRSFDERKYQMSPAHVVG